MEDAGKSDDDYCYGAGSIAGAVIGTFFVTVLLLAITAVLHKQWRRHKGKHLVLVTDPEIVDDAYAFDNPCFKYALSSVPRSPDKGNAVCLNSSTTSQGHTTAGWSAPWSSLVLGSAASHQDKKRALDDSILGPNTASISVVSLRSRDFTGLGFNVCGNMREGIFVKDLLHRGPASESGKIHPGDRIASVKISFRNMVYEDALTILSYASPYDVELEVESGKSPDVKSTTLLKKNLNSSSPLRIYHPLYRSQSIPEFGQKHVAKRLFTMNPNDTVNQASQFGLESGPFKSPGRPELHEETKTAAFYKIGIKVLPELDGTVHKIETQNEHNTNLERRNSRKVVDAGLRGNGVFSEPERQFHDETDHRARQVVGCDIPSEVHNAAMAARKNRKNVIADAESSPQKNKRKAPAPPVALDSEEQEQEQERLEDVVDGKADHPGSGNSSDVELQPQPQPKLGFTKIELNSSDITIHNIEKLDVGVDQDDDDDDEDEDLYRKAASLGDLSKYENRNSSAIGLERAQSLDMTSSEASLKKRKAPMPPPEDINESTEDLTKLDRDGPHKRKLGKYSDWTSGVPIVDPKPENVESQENQQQQQEEEEEEALREEENRQLQLFSLPLSRHLTEKFIFNERMFNPDEDNSLARIVNDGRIVKSPPLEEIELDFREAKPLTSEDDDVEEAVFTSKTTSTTLFSEKSPDSDVHVELSVVEEPMVKKVVVRKDCPGCSGTRSTGHTCRASSPAVASPHNGFGDVPLPPSSRRVEEEMENVTVNNRYPENVSNVSVHPEEEKKEEEKEEKKEEEDEEEDKPQEVAPWSPRKTYITEIKVSNVGVGDLRADHPRRDSGDRRGRKTGDAGAFENKVIVVEAGENEEIVKNGKSGFGTKKPPVPPRKSDRGQAKDAASDKQVVYVSECKSLPVTNEEKTKTEISALSEAT